MKNRHRRMQKGAYAKPFMLLAVLGILSVLSPTVLKNTPNNALSDVRSRFESMSLFFELNPFIKNKSTYTSSISDVSVIDTADTTSIEYDSLYVYDNGTKDVPPDNTQTVDNTITFRNETDIIPCVSELLEKENSFTLSGSEPNILIIHTHTSESYMPDEIYPYVPTDTSRTQDSEYNMVRIGTHLAKRLKDAGIGVIHDKTVHDYPSYSGSYARSLESIKSDMRSYPDIQIVIDIHRDAIIDDDGTAQKVLCNIYKDGQTLESAQLMLVVGTNSGGLAHPNWEDNLSFAVKLQNEINKLYPPLMRPVNLRNERFNQHVTSGSILLEVGSSGNTLGEALQGIDLFADGLIALLNEYKN